MKYALISIFGLLLAIIIPTVIVLLINKKHHIKNWLKAIIIAVSFVGLTVSFGLIYLSINYRASESVNKYLVSDSAIEYRDEDHWYAFDYKDNKDNAIIFYSGGKVESKAYAPLCSEIAHTGVDVYLIKMPLAFPLLDINSANRVDISAYKNVYMMGHSLGGTTASIYLSKTNRSYKGVIFLASYPNTKLSDSLKCLSIYGTNDKVLNKDAYNNNKDNFPKGYQEVVIEGGNHSYFGDYGDQRGDGEASISREEQIIYIKNAVSSFLI